MKFHVFSRPSPGHHFARFLKLPKGRRQRRQPLNYSLSFKLSAFSKFFIEFDLNLGSIEATPQNPGQSVNPCQMLENEGDEGQEKKNQHQINENGPA